MDPSLWSPNLCSICIETIEEGDHYMDMFGQKWDSHTSCQVADTERAFVRFSGEWKQQTRMMSSLSDIVNNSAYQHIIAIGWSIVPRIIDDLRGGPKHWYHALAEITGIDAAHGDDTMAGAADRWIEWWDNLHRIVPNDGYPRCSCGWTSPPGQAYDDRPLHALKEHVRVKNGAGQ